MRRFLLVLIALGLSWTATAYACGMGGEILLPACCCEGVGAQSCPTPASSCTAEAMTGTQGDGCCSLIVTPAASVQGEIEAPTTPNLLSAPATERTARIIRRDIPILPRRTAHDRSTPSIYLLTGRLRR